MCNALDGTALDSTSHRRVTCAVGDVAQDARVCAEAAAAALKMKSKTWDSLTPTSKQNKMQAPATPSTGGTGRLQLPNGTWTTVRGMCGPLTPAGYRVAGYLFDLTPTFNTGAPRCSNGLTATQSSARVQLPNGTWTTVKVGAFRCPYSCTLPLPARA